MDTGIFLWKLGFDQTLALGYTGNGSLKCEIIRVSGAKHVFSMSMVHVGRSTRT